MRRSCAIFRSRFDIPLNDEECMDVAFYRPPEDSEEMRYLRERRAALGGYVPQRHVRSKPLVADHDELFKEFLQGSGGREVSTTMAFVQMLRKMLSDPEIGQADRADRSRRSANVRHGVALSAWWGFIRAWGRSTSRWTATCCSTTRKRRDGQILEEGITEAGSMGSFIAAGSAYATHGVNTIPFFIYYSMFGFQRMADFIWAAADMRTRGFLLGGTSGRTTLSGEGLQHQDGNSHVLALSVPNLLAYDPAFAYEMAVIIQDGIRRMYKDGENIFYYMTVMNEPYAMPPMPAGVKEGILKGMYRFRPAADSKSKLRAQLFGSGAILNEAVRAQEILRRSTAWPRTSGASRATSRSTTMASKPSDGTGCIPAKSRACPMSRNCWPMRPACWWRLRIT